MSHGESYIELFKSRLVTEALYILVEPELSLSPMRQLALLSLIKDMVSKNCQFIIITHSPILMASDDAKIYDFNNESISLIDYDDVEHVTFKQTRMIFKYLEKYKKSIVNIVLLPLNGIIVIIDATF